MSPFFMPTSQVKKAAPTGPRPSSATASQPDGAAGQTVSSTIRCTASDSAAVARQKTVTLSVGTSPSRRDSTE